MKIARLRINRETGNFALGKKELSNEIEAIILSWRPVAIEFKKGKVKRYFDLESSEFKKVQKTFDGGGGFNPPLDFKNLSKQIKMESSAYVGVEFLLYIPSEKKYTSYNPSRHNLMQFKSAMNQLVTLVTESCKSRHFTWYRPRVITAIERLTNEKQRNKAMEKFNTQKKEVEKV